MTTTKLVLTSVLAGATLGILFAPAKGEDVRSKLTLNKNNFESKLEKELKKFDKAVRKQLKEAKKEIRELVENQPALPYDLKNSV